MQCQSCHKELIEGAKFCKFCGAKQEVSPLRSQNHEDKQEAVPLLNTDLQTKHNNPLQKNPIVYTSPENAVISAEPLVEASPSIQPIQFEEKKQSEDSFTAPLKQNQQESYSDASGRKDAAESENERSDMQKLNPAVLQEEVGSEAEKNDFLNALREFREVVNPEERIPDNSNVETVRATPSFDAEMKQEFDPRFTAASISQSQEKKHASKTALETPQKSVTENVEVHSLPTKKAQYSESKFSAWSIIWRLLIILGECIVITCYIWFFFIEVK